MAEQDIVDRPWQRTGGRLVRTVMSGEQPEVEPTEEEQPEPIVNPVESREPTDNMSDTTVIAKALREPPTFDGSPGKYMMFMMRLRSYCAIYKCA